ncbi:hypothetical protein [Flavobacterium sp. 2755]|uniref:hypothetical protein n=1 Tax=Flavobacterium sp. 2755 TaxID=2817765 RepID=UPI00286D649D|nr:hypothetical protein [Flavobacterium sp. 2755]
MMNNKYPLEWIDALIVKHLNPSITDLGRLSESDLAVILKHVPIESGRIQVRIKSEIFVLRTKRQIRLLVRKYHSTLIYLLDIIVESSKDKVFQLPVLSRTAEVVIKSLDELLSFLENRFSAYLSLDERVPITYLLVSRKELGHKLKKMQCFTLDRNEDTMVLKVIIDELSGALSLQNKNKITFRHVMYIRAFLNEIENFDCLQVDESFFSALDHKAIGLNFNCPAYVQLLTGRITAQLELQEDVTQKLSLLSYCFKEFSQILSTDKLFFNAGLQDLKTVLQNWFRHEMQFREKQLEMRAAGSDKGKDSVEQEGNKVECDLSADQIGIILRAADEARIVKSRSMSLVFQKIVPHLSTAFKRDLSYQSVRSKSYNAEESDKNTAILTLEKMIRKIRTY